MPLRHMIADSLIYLKEYNEITAKNRNEKNFDTSDKFLSGLQKSDRLHPVISLCIYYGKEDWDGPFNLVDMLIMPEYLKPLVSDYRVNSGFCCKFTINYQTGISNNRERK